MQVRTLPGLVLPQLPTHTSARTVEPVAAQSDEGSRTALPAPQPRRTVSNEELTLARENQRYSYSKLNADGSKTTQALQTYFDIQTQEEQERSQTLLGIDIHA